MNTASDTYRLLSRLTALLLLTSFLLPVALQASQLADFCMMEMNHHEMSSHQILDRSHESCESSEEEKESSAHDHHDCEGGSFCACDVDQFPLNKKILVPASSVAIILQKDRFNLTLFSPDEPLRPDQQARIGQYDPPVYLLYDTLLI